MPKQHENRSDTNSLVELADDPLFDSMETDVKMGIDSSMDELPVGNREVVIEAMTRWAADLTYDDIHAFGIGFIPLFVGLAVGFGPLVTASLLVGVAALGHHKLNNRAFGYVVRNPYYAFSGQFVAIVTGGLIAATRLLVTSLVGVIA